MSDQKPRPTCTDHGRPYDAMGACSDPQCPAHGSSAAPKRPLLVSVNLREWEATRARLERLERVAEAARDMAHERAMPGSEDWFAARDALRAALEDLDAPEGSAP